MGNRKFQKKIRNSKKSKNTIVASIQAKIGWKRSRKFQKNSENIKKIQKYDYGFISSQNRLGKAQR